MNTHSSSHSSRRQFVRTAGLGLAALALDPLGRTVPRVFASSASAAPAAGENAEPRALVVIHLQGGYDGLSTFVPLHDDRYYRQRPTLALPRGGLIALGETHALNRAGRPLERLFNDGRLAVALDAGDAPPSASHYRAAEIRHTASAADDVIYSGWVGRCFSHLREEGRAVRGDYATTGLARPPRLFVREEDRDRGGVTALEADDFRCPLAACGGGDPLAALAEVGERAGVGRGTEVFFIAVPGFDTHAGQADTHDARLHALSVALESFQRRLERRGVADRVLTMAFSEFGRSLSENAQGGTDHGHGSPVLLLGKNVRGGFHRGSGPTTDGPGNATSIASGFAAPMDFRRIARTITTDWLRVPVDAVFARDPGRTELLNVPALS